MSIEVSILKTNERGSLEYAIVSLDNLNYGLWLMIFNNYNDAYNYCNTYNYNIRNKKKPWEIIFKSKPIKFEQQLGLLS